MRSNCIVCQAFPDHTGTHYSLQDVRTLAFAYRRRTVGPVTNVPLEGTHTAQGENISAAMQMSNHPAAVPVEGLWLVPHSGAIVTERPDLPAEAPPPAASSPFSLGLDGDSLEAAVELRRRKLGVGMRGGAVGAS